MVHLYSDKHAGGGGSWGLGVGLGDLIGNLSHDSWWTLCSVENRFYVEGAAAGAAMEFYIDGSYVGQFVGGDLGAMVGAGFDGWMDWS